MPAAEVADRFGYSTVGVQQMAILLREAGWFTSVDTAADLGYTGVAGIRIVPLRTPPGVQRDDSQAAFNTALSKIRAAVEHAIAHLTTWRMPSEEGGRYRPPIGKYASMLRAIIGLFFFTSYE